MATFRRFKAIPGTRIIPRTGDPPQFIHAQAGWRFRKAEFVFFRGFWFVGFRGEKRPLSRTTKKHDDKRNPHEATASSRFRALEKRVVELDAVGYGEDFGFLSEASVL